jgi:signal transduction histidine kinase
MGMAVLAIRRVEGWVYGFWMMAILAAGFALQLAIAQSGSDYPAAVRLAQMTAYPFLLLLAQRTALAQIPVQVSAAAETADRSSLSAAVSSRYADPQLWQALTRLATESEPERVCGGITALLAEIMQADLCLLLLPPDGAGKMVVRCGYNLKEKRQLGSLTLDSRALPMLVSSLRMGRSRRFASGSTSPDLASLARAYQLEHAGNLLFAPVLSPDGKPLISVLLLSPYTDRDWNADEQAFLGVLSRLLVHFLQRSQQMESLKEDLDQARQITRLAQEQAQQAVDERQKLRDRVAVLEEHVQHDQLQLASLAAASAAYEQAQSSITQLQAENEKLSEAFRLATENSARQQQAAEGELRLALEEIVFLKTALADTDQKILALKSVEVDATLPGAQLDVVMAIAQDLRQPLSSIVGYTDFLLSEKSGILVMQQRKQLERIKIATERMNRLVDDLLQAISPESNPLRLKFSDVDAREVIQQAVTEISQFRRERGIALQLDLPEEPLRIRSDRYALANVFAQLLQNASQASPPGGDVKMKVLVESNEGQVDYLLVQVSDSSNGFEAQDLVRVFTPRPADAQEEGNPVDMPRLKALVEALGGRAWVDSEPGHGATISVLLPVSPSVSGGNGRGVAK